MPYAHEEATDATTTWFVERVSEQDAAHDGEALRRWSRAVLAELPRGPVDLVATSTEGCALAAVVAALRVDAPTRWRRLAFGREDGVPRDSAVVVVEPVELGGGLREAIARELPGAVIICGLAVREPAAAAA